MIPKINLSKNIRWPHHRSGWGYCLDCLSVLHNPCGVITIGSVEEATKKNTLPNKPWFGFVHNTPHHPKIMKCLYGSFHGGFDLSTLFSISEFKQSLKTCYGLFCFSESILQCINSYTNVPCEKLFHATEIPETVFVWDKFVANKRKKLIMVGHWMRNWQAIFDLPKTEYQKCILKGVGSFNYNNILECCETNDSVVFISRLENEDYDKHLSENLVFLNLFDSGANNAIIECMARQTPVIVNRLPSTQEYLGDAYPLLYDSVEEVPSLLTEENIMKAHQYLLNVKYKITSDNFLQSFISSKIYSNIPYVSL